MSSQGAAISSEEKHVENKEVRILVVDDEQMMSDSLRQNFIEEGYSVDTAATGAAAIELSIKVVITWRFVICSYPTWTDLKSCVT